jgi:hypothetical protein
MTDEARTWATASKLAYIAEINPRRFRFFSRVISQLVRDVRRRGGRDHAPRGVRPFVTRDERRQREQATHAVIMQAGDDYERARTNEARRDAVTRAVEAIHAHVAFFERSPHHDEGEER